MILRSTGISTVRLRWRGELQNTEIGETAARVLAILKTDAAAMARVRQLLAVDDWRYKPSWRMTDDEVLAVVSRLMRAGELLAGIERNPPLSAPSDRGGATTPAAAPAQAQQRQEQPEEPTFGGSHDGATQAGGLAAAALAGTPFCEVCQR